MGDTAALTSPSALTAPTVPIVPAAMPDTLPTPAPASGTQTVAARPALPAPLYVLSSAGEVVRMNGDGSPPAPVVQAADDGTIVAFDVSRSSGALVYVLQAEDGNRTLVYAPADERRPVDLVRGQVAAPLFLQDDPLARELDPASTGQRVAYHVEQPLPDIPPERAGPGLFESSDMGTCPFLVVPDDPQQAGQETPPPGARAFVPLMLSPDGISLLVREEIAPDEQRLAVVLADSRVVELHHHDDMPLVCCDASWSTDGRSVYVADNLGIWRADAASGVATFVLAGSDAGNGIVRFPQQQANGDLLFFYRLLAEQTNAPPHTVMYRTAADGNGAWQALRDDALHLEHVRWAQDGSGAVVEVRGEGEKPLLLWLAASGGAPHVLAYEQYAGGGHIRWGPTATPAAPLE